MELRILLFTLLLVFIIVGNVDSRKSGSSGRGSSGRGSSGRGTSGRGSSGSSYGSSGSRYGSSGSRYGSSVSKPVSKPTHSWPSPSSTKPLPRTPSKPTNTWSSLPSTKPLPRAPSKPTNTWSSPSSNQGHKEATQDFLHGEGGGRVHKGTNSGNQHTFPKPSAPVPQHPIKPSAPSLPHGIQSGVHPRVPPIVTDGKQQTSPYKPSAPLPDYISKATAPSLESHRSPTFGQGVGSYPGNNRPVGSPYPTNNHPVGSPYPTNNHPVGSPYPTNNHQGGMPHPQSTQPIRAPIGFENHNSGAGHFNQPIGHQSYPAQTFGSPYQPTQVGPVGNPYPSQPIGTFHNPAVHHYPVQTGPVYGQPAVHHYPVQTGPVYGQPVVHPYVPPTQTVVVVPGHSTDNGRGVGQIVKEALIHTAVNAAVHKVFSPSHSNGYRPDYYDRGVPRPVGETSNVASTSTTSNTQITYNNQYFNQPPPGANGPVTAVADSTVNVNAPAGTGVLPNNPAPNQPTLGQSNSMVGPNAIQSSVVNVPLSHGNGTVASNQGTVASNQGTEASNQGTVASNQGTVASNQGTISQSNNTMNGTAQSQGNSPVDPNFVNGFQYVITDEQLWNLTEELFAKDDNSAYNYTTLNLQNRTKGYNGTDEAAEPLISLRSEAYLIPTVQAVRSLYDNYEFDNMVKENVTADERKEENLLLDVFLDTRVMKTAMGFLANQSLIESAPYTYKDTLKSIWFTQYSGSTSGFERIFMGELYNGGTIVFGVQDWIYFDAVESAKRANYLGHSGKVDLGNKAALVKISFALNGVVRPDATIFVGTSPELEMALYTVCFFARPSDNCVVSLGGTRFTIYTHTFRYFGKDLIDLALPLI